MGTGANSPSCSLGDALLRLGVVELSRKTFAAFVCLPVTQEKLKMTAATPNLMLIFEEILSAGCTTAC